MSLVRCHWCGEVMDAAKSPHCPGCGALIKEKDAPVKAELVAPSAMKTPLRISPARREAEKDSNVLVIVLTAVGVVIIIPAMTAFAGQLGVPWIFGLLLAAIVYAGVVALVERNDRQQREADRAYARILQAQSESGERKVAYHETPRPAVRSAGGVVYGVLTTLLAIFGLIALAIALPIIGAAIALYVMCMQMSGQL